MVVIKFLKSKSLMFMLAWICLPAFAQTAQCEEWQNKLQTEIRSANQCEAKHQACLVKEFGNPMRELDYCKKVFNRCESFEARPETGNLPKEVEAFKKQCAG
jgi:hypothetical protein